MVNKRPTLGFTTSAIESLKEGNYRKDDVIYVSEREAEFKVVKTQREKYISTLSSGSHSSRLEIAGSGLSDIGFNTLPSGTILEFDFRIDSDSSVPSAPLDISIGNSGPYVGFYTSSGKIHFQVQVNSQGSLEIDSLIDENNEYIGEVSQFNVSGLVKNKWYTGRVKVINPSGITIGSSSNIRIGAYYLNSKNHYKSFGIYKPNGDRLEWDFNQGLLISKEDNKHLVMVGTTSFVDDENVGNDLDIIENESPYKLFKIVPRGNFITPKNFGAKRSTNIYNTSDAVDATDIIQKCIDSPYDVLIDGFYYVKGYPRIGSGTYNFGSVGHEPFRVAFSITRPKYIKLDGCLYTGKDPVDLFQIFTSNFNLDGNGYIDLTNTLYDLASNTGLTHHHTLSPYYVPPKVFSYYYWKNLIWGGKIHTTILGKQTETRKYNAGHIGVFFDCSRTPSRDPQSKGVFSEMHFIDFKLDTEYLYSTYYGRLDEPYQDFTTNCGITNFGTILPEYSGFISSGVIPNSGSYILNSPSNFNVEHNRARRLSIKWGKSSIANLFVLWSNGQSFVDNINRELIDNGISTDISGVLPAFKAEPQVGGTNRSFTLRSNQDEFSVTAYMAPGNTNHQTRIDSLGNKQTVYIQTGNHCNLNLQDQTMLVLSKGSGELLDEVYSEWNFPVCTVDSQWNILNIDSVDLAKGNEDPTYKTADRALDLLEDRNILKEVPMFEDSLVSNVHNIKARPFTTEGYLRNPKYLSHTHYHVTNGSDSFVGALDNCLHAATERFTVTTKYYKTSGNFDFTTSGNWIPSSGRVVSGLTEYTPATGVGFSTGLFNDVTAKWNMTYNTDTHEDNDFIEIVIDNISPPLGYSNGGYNIEPVKHYIETVDANTCKKIQLIQQGNNNIYYSSIKDLVGDKNTWHEFVMPYVGAKRLILRLIGCKDKTKIFYLNQWAAKGAKCTSETKPYLGIAGGNVHGATYFKDMRVKKATGTNEFQKITPQPSGSIPDLNTLITRLVSAGIIY